jgi:pimeloyl-ACP methyl ester carboxylesterase
MLTYAHDGLCLAYATVGAGAPVLFVHGATGTGMFDWGRLAGDLSSGYRCIVPDLRGHGRSGFRLPGYGGDAIAGDLRELLKLLGVGQPHIIGFSYGAEVALRLEIEKPGTARSLILVSPGTGRPRSYRMPSLEYMHRVWPRSLRELHEARHGPDHWSTLVTLLQQDSARQAELPPEDLIRISCPVLLLAGDHDEPTRRRQGKRFADVSPRARYLEIEGAAHAAHLERPAEVAWAVREFLAETDGQASLAPTRAPTDQESSS